MCFRALLWLYLSYKANESIARRVKTILWIQTSANAKFRFHTPFKGIWYDNMILKISKLNKYIKIFRFSKFQIKIDCSVSALVSARCKIWKEQHFSFHWEKIIPRGIFFQFLHSIEIQQISSGKFKFWVENSLMQILNVPRGNLLNFDRM